ncbi:MAG TPA: VTT domain-containing protein [Terriglobales bacterium]|nr:VTT domain-containing protein [Terriglobales bacterium]
MELRLLAIIESSASLHWLIRLGGPGLILLGLADNSVVPLPGSMDVLTIWLAASNHELWPYYALMATLGALIGGYVTYRLARKGGKEALEHRFPKKRTEKLYKQFEHWGFRAVAIPAVLPPPFPIVPALLAAGALQYPRKKFLGALAIGRGIRFMVLAFLGAHYGPAIVAFFSQYYKPALFTLIGLAVAGCVVALVEYLRFRKKHAQHANLPSEPAAPGKAA